MNTPYYPANMLAEEANSSASSSWSPTRSDFIVGAHRRGVHSWNVPWGSQPIEQTSAAPMGLEPSFAPGPSAYQYDTYDTVQYAQAPTFLDESQWAAAPATYSGVDSAPVLQQSYIQWPQQEQAVDYTAAGPTPQPAASFAQYVQYPMQQQESYDNTYYAPYAYDATDFS